jgi:hypothetical protein
VLRHGVHLAGPVQSALPVEAEVKA